jgi:hypothetical protein
MTLEIDIEDEACEQALLLGVTNVKLNPAGTNGWPDRIFFIPGGRPLLIEFKRPDELARPLQQVIHRRLTYYGYQVQTHCTVQGAIDAIKAAMLESAWVPKESGKISIRTRRRRPTA